MQSPEFWDTRGEERQEEYVWVGDVYEEGECEGKVEWGEEGVCGIDVEEGDLAITVALRINRWTDE